MVVKLSDAKRILEEVKELDDSIYMYNPSYKEALETVLKPQWIPMSERIPNVGQDVLVTTRDVRMYVVTYDLKEWIPGHCFRWKPNFMGAEYLDENDVIAWMPLPEPYQEAEHERDK